MASRQEQIDLIFARNETNNAEILQIAQQLQHLYFNPWVAPNPNNPSSGDYPNRPTPMAVLRRVVHRLDHDTQEKTQLQAEKEQLMTQVHQLKTELVALQDKLDRDSHDRQVQNEEQELQNHLNLTAHASANEQLERQLTEYEDRLKEV